MIIDIFKKKTVKQDIILSVSLLLVFMAIAVSWGIYVINSLSDHEEKINQIKELKNNLLLASYQETSFKTYGYKKDIFFDNKSTEQIADFYSKMNKFDSLLNKMNIDLDKKRKISFFSKSYQKEFTNLVDKFFERGYKDYGKEGSLNQIIQAIENSSTPYERSDLLSLRKHEKDFFIKKEKIHIDEFSKAMKYFVKNNIGFSFNNSFEKDKLAEQISTYGEKFYQLVDIEQEIGFTEKDGINGKITQYIENLLQETSKLENQIKEDKLVYKKFHYTILLLVIFFLAIISIAYTMNLANKIEQPIKVVQSYLEKLCLGIIPDKLTSNTSDIVLITIIQSLNSLRERISTINNNLKQIGEGKYEIEIEIRSEFDETGSALTIMRDNLIIIKKKDEERNWSNIGYTNFANIMRNFYDVSSLCNGFVSELSHYLNVNQVFLFLAEENTDDREKSILKLETAYAFNKKKFIRKEFEAGEALTGQAYLERQAIYLDDVPQDYIEITSGLGEANPKSVLIVPIQTTEYIVGVLEIASFKTIEAFEIEFCEKLAENLATVLASMRINEQTKRLLDTSRIQAENQKMQEEEMRQNLEEMEAIQEEMLRKENEYIRRIESLEEELAQKS